MSRPTPASPPVQRRLRRLLNAAATAAATATAAAAAAALAWFGLWGGQGGEASAQPAPTRVESFVWEVGPWHVPCSHGEEYHGMCMQVRAKGETTWRSEPNTIKGFTPRWGRTYEVRFTRAWLPPDEVPADHSGYDQRLDAVDVDAAAAFPLAFEVHLDVSFGSLGWTPLVSVDADDKGGAFSDGQRFTCADPALCATLRAALGRTHAQYLADKATPRAFTGAFTWTDPAAPPALTGLKPAP